MFANARATIAVGDAPPSPPPGGCVSPSLQLKGQPDMAAIERTKRERLEERLRNLADDVKNALDEANPDGVARITTDAILVVGTRSYNDDGVCVGTVYTFSLESSMPGYIARGLLSDAIDDMIGEVEP
ncbi:gp4 [Mycobacterium phage Barnyard]|uniref:Uncharacterized protein n=1 Tax=Mycobacterium phage Barnyard TaxID=205880 RepID=Q856G8_9CAUD|nr:gp4 [Mycobacterium phage Barnyard]AAN02058.1 hypothetical protein PBI_BARNYARD_4 [Mycobacterium phage Barnyard]